MYFKDSLLYWKKNISKFLFIFLAVVIGMAAIIVSALLVRSQKIAELEETLVLGGNYDFIFYDVGEETKQAIIGMESVAETGEIITAGMAYAGQTEFPVGAMGSSRAEEMFHLAMLEGRYPREQGEIAMDRITMLEMGLMPETGQTIRLGIGEEGSRTEREYRVVGIIEQQYIEDWNGNIYCRRMYRDDYLDGETSIAEVKAPFAYIFRDEAETLPSKGLSILMVNARTDRERGEVDFCYEYDKYAEQAQDQDVKIDFTAGATRSNCASNLLGHKGGEAWYSLHGYQEAAGRIGTESTEKDVYSRILIPLFAVLIAVATFFSLFEAVSSVFVTREQQMGVYRCMGMSKGQVICKTLVELLVAMVPAVLAGCLAGTLVYEGILWVTNCGFGMRIPQAFAMEPYFAPFIKAATVPPYACAIVPVAVVLIVVVGIFLFKNARLSPLASSNRRRYALRKDRMNQALLGVNVVLLVVVMTAAFLYFKGEAELNTSSDADALQTLFYGQSDYMMDRDEGKCYIGENERRHDGGVSPEDFGILRESPLVDTVHGIIECYGTKLVYTDDMKVDAEALADCSMDKKMLVSYGSDPVEVDLFHEGWGYKKTDRIYKAPTVAAEEEDVAGFSDCLFSGEINMDAINAGQEVLIVVDEGTDVPFHAGDVLPMDMLVYPKEVDESEVLIAGGRLEEDEEPTYPETEEHRALYVYGERKDWQVKVGGIVRLDAERASFFRAEEQTPWDPDWNILTTTEGMAAWELPAVNYTKLVVKLKEDTDTEEFEKLWFSIFSRSKIMITKSVEGLNAKIATVYQKNQTIFSALVTMMMLASMVGILNAVHMRVLSHKRRNAMMRALGQENKKGIWNIQKGQAVMVLCGCAAAEIMVFVLGRLSRIVYDVEMEWGTTGESPEEGWWGFSFPFYGKLWEWQNYLPAIVIGLAIFVIAGVVTYITYKGAVGKESIAESMREE